MITTTQCNPQTKQKFKIRAPAHKLIANKIDSQYIHTAKNKSKQKIFQSVLHSVYRNEIRAQIKKSILAQTTVRKRDHPEQTHTNKNKYQT